MTKSRINAVISTSERGEILLDEQISPIVEMTRILMLSLATKRGISCPFCPFYERGGQHKKYQNVT